MLSFNEIKKGVRIILNNEPCEVIESSHMFKGRGQSVIQAKIKNLRSGTIFSKTFRSFESFKEAELIKFKATFLYENKKGYYFFCREDDPKKRFNLSREQLGDKIKFLKQGESVEGIIFQNDIINISLPIKVLLKVIEASPGIKGDRAQSGTKPVKLENNTEILVPLFIKQDDIIEVNTEKEEYVRRV